MNATTITAAVYSPTAGIVAKCSSFDEAAGLAKGQNRACAARGGYGDRTAYAVDEDGILRTETGAPVWPPHGRSAGAVRV